MGIFYKAIVHKKRFGQAYRRNLLKMNPRKFSSHFSEFYTIYYEVSNFKQFLGI
jgi:hypothetical protein